MSDSQNRDEGIFNGALQLPPDQRDEYIKKSCGDDAELCGRVKALLEAHEKSGQFLEESAATTKKTIVLSFELTEKAGDRIGRYKLLQQLGEGGCGVVYMAEQEEPVRRRVALKVIKLGMDTKSVIARFEAERQALALMDHPNIAKVLDAGATETGRPYFVMELVRGVKITEYCDQNKLSTEERLKLFVQVCHAIQHAHQKGIIHRDIKPSNILVTLHDGVPVPKVIDFGIAKATQGRLTDQTLFTAFEQFIGTPAYMSPEQAEMSGLDVDTRSDVYALGVLLYELLTGRTPFDAKELLQSGLDELRRTIRETEPARPSTRLSTLLDADLTTVAQRRKEDAPKLIHMLAGDLDWIVMKALEKDRTRRFETANGLAADIQRYLRNDAVEARPPSTLYRLQKLVRRNRTIFAAAGAGITALVIGLLLSLYLFAQEKSALRRAVDAEQKEKHLREQAEAGAALGRTLTTAGLALMRGQYDESEKLVASVAPHSTMVPFFDTLGSRHARRGEWGAALTNWDLVVKYAPEDHLGYHYLAPLLLKIADVDGYRKCRTEILQHFGNTQDPITAERMTKDCLILPPSESELQAVDRMFEAAATVVSTNRQWPFVQIAKGLMEYRSGNYEAAVASEQKALPKDIGGHCRTEAKLVLAMAQFRLGRAQESQAAMAEAVSLVRDRLPKEGDLSDEWNDWIIVQFLLREARSLLPELKGAVVEDAKQPDWLVALWKTGWKPQTTRHDDGTWEVDMDDQAVADLGPLKGAPVTHLSAMHTAVTDLGPLRGMKLTWLRLAGTKVSDLSPLQGMPLESLQLSGTQVSDLEPLRGMPLEVLNMTSCTNITNLEPLKGITTFQSVILPPNAKDYEFLRTCPDLKRIGFKYDRASRGPDKSSTDFWAEYDKAHGATSAAGGTP